LSRKPQQSQCLHSLPPKLHNGSKFTTYGQLPDFKSLWWAILGQFLRYTLSTCTPSNKGFVTFFYDFPLHFPLFVANNYILLAEDVATFIETPKYSHAKAYRAFLAAY